MSCVPIFSFPTLNWQSSILGKIYQLLSKDQVGRIGQCLAEKFPALTDIDLWIDYLIDVLTNGPGDIIVQINEVVPVKNSTISIESLTISGLDSFSEITLLEPSETSNVTLNTKISLDYLQLALNTTLAGSPSSGYQGIIFLQSLSRCTFVIPTSAMFMF